MSARSIWSIFGYQVGAILGRDFGALDSRPNVPLQAPDIQEKIKMVESITVRSVKNAQGRFEHPAEHFPAWIEHGFSGVRKWRATVEPTPIMSEAELDESLPVLKPSAEALASPPQDKIQVTWLGHASVLTQFNGWNVLADPVFSHRCSPVQWAGPARVRPAALSVSELPNIDAIVISHSHYDHLDLDSVVALASRAQPIPPVWFVPLGMKDWMKSSGVTNVVEMDWAEEATMRCERTETLKRADLKITCLPCQHWCARTPFDRNTVLWASWHVATKHGSYYFGGDTGYCGAVFQQIGSALGCIDLASIPIGAYGADSERWFHQPNHMSPEEAVQCREDLRAAHAVAIHWGTFQLTAEPLLEPPRRLRSAAEARGLSEAEFAVMRHGEVRSFPCGRSRDRAPSEKQK